MSLLRSRWPAIPRARAAALLIAVALLAGAARADVADPFDPGSGALHALAPDGAPLGPCPLQHTDVAIEIAGFVARVRVTQVFTNPFPDPIEAVYTFPLSRRGAVDAMWMRTGGREIRGEIHRREEARRLYDQARDRGQVAALLDQERPNVFTQSLANLMPGATVEIEIHYVETLAYEEGSFELVFPTVVGPRFVPGAPRGASGTGWAPDTDRVPDGSRLTPPVAPEGTRAGHDLAIAVEIDAGVPLGRVQVPLHEVEVRRDGKRRARVVLARRDEIPNRDFVLRYEVAADEIRSGVLAHRDEGAGTVTFLLLPPKRVSPGDAAPKEIVFVVDRSGSQRGLPLQKAKETMLWILEHMHPNDTFQVVDFGSTANVLFDRPRLASPTMKAEARRYIQRLEANGGTMMAEAVERVAGLPTEGHRLRTVVFMTDGYVGNDHEVIELVRRLRGTSRWFAFGTGNSVNRYLLDGIAREGGGESEVVLLDRPGREVAERFWKRMASPVLTDVTLEFRDLDVYEVYPQEVSDLWAGRPLVIQARYDQPGRGQVILRGRHGSELVRQVLEVRLPRRGGNDALTSLWARAKVDALLRRDLQGLQTGRFAPGLEAEVVEVALAHRILTPFTSFLAVEDRVVNRGGRQWTETVPVEMPQGVTHEGVFGKGEALASSAAVPSPGVRRFVDVGRLRSGRAPMTQERKPGLGGPTLVPEEGEARDAAVPSSADERVRTRLAPVLRELLDGLRPRSATLDAAGERVRVQVVLREAPADLREALERVGLAVESQSRREAVGWIAVKALARLAGLDFVERIEAA